MSEPCDPVVVGVFPSLLVVGSTRDVSSEICVPSTLPENEVLRLGCLHETSSTGPGTPCAVPTSPVGPLLSRLDPLGVPL